MITSICSQCHHVYENDDAMLHKEIDCEECHKKLVVVQAKCCPDCSNWNPPQAFQCWNCKKTIVSVKPGGGTDAAAPAVPKIELPKPAETPPQPDGAIPKIERPKPAETPTPPEEKAAEPAVPKERPKIGIRKSGDMSATSASASPAAIEPPKERSKIGIRKPDVPSAAPTATHPAPPSAPAAPKIEPPKMSVPDGAPKMELPKPVVTPPPSATAAPKIEPPKMSVPGGAPKMELPKPSMTPPAIQVQKHEQSTPVPPRGVPAEPPPIRSGSGATKKIVKAIVQLILLAAACGGLYYAWTIYQERTAGDSGSTGTGGGRRNNLSQEEAAELAIKEADIVKMLVQLAKKDSLNGKTTPSQNVANAIQFFQMMEFTGDAKTRAEHAKTFLDRYETLVKPLDIGPVNPQTRRDFVRLVVFAQSDAADAMKRLGLPFDGPEPPPFDSVVRILSEDAFAKLAPDAIKTVFGENFDEFSALWRKICGESVTLYERSTEYLQTCAKKLEEPVFNSRKTSFPYKNFKEYQKKASQEEKDQLLRFMKRSTLTTDCGGVKLTYAQIEAQIANNLKEINTLKTIPLPNYLLISGIELTGEGDPILAGPSFDAQTTAAPAQPAKEPTDDTQKPPAETASAPDEGSDTPETKNAPEKPDASTAPAHPAKEPTDEKPAGGSLADRLRKKK